MAITVPIGGRVDYSTWMRRVQSLGDFYKVQGIEMSAKVFEYVVILNPTKEAKESGERAKIMSGTSGPVLIVADAIETARLEALVECSTDLAKLDKNSLSRVEVLVRPFV